MQQAGRPSWALDAKSMAQRPVGKGCMFIGKNGVMKQLLKLSKLSD